MELVKPSIEFMNSTEKPLQAIELAGRTCYKSEDKITDISAEKFVKMLIDRGHEAMIEHASASYRITCDRGVTHEIVRHRLFSYAQESTRYCNYKNGVTFIIPSWEDIPAGQYDIAWKNKYGTCVNEPDSSIGANRWFWSMALSERDYVRVMSEAHWTPQQARSVLPNSLKTEIVITGNLREWRHFFRLRTAKAAHPQMREVANMVLSDIVKRIPVIFDEFNKELESEPPDEILEAIEAADLALHSCAMYLLDKGSGP